VAETSTRVERDAQSESADAALRFARRVHFGQHRKQTGEQFVEHPIGVARLLAGIGCDDTVIVAAYLHDVVEKTKVESEEIRDRFGEDVAAIVDALTEDPDLDTYERRKRALRAQVLAAGHTPTLIYAADRVANLRDWRSVDPERRPAIAERLGTSLDERLRLWDEDLDELVGFDPDLPFLAELELELRALRADAA
jgi:(p)ppGpp synthase/HD superfamily hydrolase